MKESPIFVKTFDFMNWLLHHTNNFPKSQRFVLAKQLQDTAFSLYNTLLRAGLYTEERKEALRLADFELEKLKNYIRLSRDMQCSNISQYEHASRSLVEIGKLLGGWMKKI